MCGINETYVPKTSVSKHAVNKPVGVCRNSGRKPLPFSGIVAANVKSTWRETVGSSADCGQMESECRLNGCLPSKMCLQARVFLLPLDKGLKTPAAVLVNKIRYRSTATPLRLRSLCGCFGSRGQSESLCKRTNVLELLRCLSSRLLQKKLANVCNRPGASRGQRGTYFKLRNYLF